MEAKLVLLQPRAVTVVEAIVEQLVQQIQAGVLQPGDKLPSERRLIEQLGVSRSSVREALQGLAMMGLVESRPGQGTFISKSIHLLPPNIESPSLSRHLKRDMRLNLIDARTMIEGNIARLAAQQAKPEDIAHLRQTFADYQDLTLNGSYRKALDGPHHEFHIALAEMTKNAFYPPVLETLLRAVPQTLRESELTALNQAELQSLLRTEVALHRAILEAIERKDGPAAQRAIEEHMDFERRLVLQILGSPDGAVHAGDAT